MELKLEKVAPVAGIVGPLIKVAADAYVAGRNPAYDLLNTSISQLEAGPLGWVARVGTVVSSLFFIVLLSGLARDVLKGRRKSFYFLMLQPVFSIVSAIFPNDLLGAFHSFYGLIHSISAYVTFGTFPLMCFVLGFAFRHNQIWRSLYAYSIITGSLLIALGIVRALLPLDLSWFGLYELILVLFFGVWYGFVAARYLSLSRHPESSLQA